MKDQFQLYCAAADGADARRSRAERVAFDAADAPRDRPRDKVRDGSRDSARDARNARAERIGAAGFDAPRDDSGRSVRDGSRDSARDARNARGEQVPAAGFDTPRDHSAGSVRDSFRDGTRDVPLDRSRDNAQDSPRDAAHDSARDRSRDARIAAERRLLAALCQGSIAADARGEVVRRLSKHAFGDPEHELIFRALAKIPSGDAEFVRAALGLRLTRAGFPDFDLEPFFDAAPPDAAELAEIWREFDSL